MFIAPKFRTHAIPNFYHLAHALRAKYDEFFVNPYDQTIAKHGKLNLWHVDNLYAYLRADMRDIVGPHLFADFMLHMRNLATSLGYSQVADPFLSIYINGCHQALHSDMMNGSLAYVYSLTHNDRKFTGGETLVAKENVFDNIIVREHRGMPSYMEVHPPIFNQLLLFDDRLAHMVPTIIGTMNPLDARVVIHGHIF